MRAPARMTFDQFLTKYVTPLDREQARRDLTAVVAHLEVDDRQAMAQLEGYRRAIEDVRTAVRAEVRFDRFKRWLQDREAPPPT